MYQAFPKSTMRTPQLLMAVVNHRQSCFLLVVHPPIISAAALPALSALESQFTSACSLHCIYLCFTPKLSRLVLLLVLFSIFFFRK